MASAYTEEQIDLYLDAIRIPEIYHRKNRPSRDINFLTALHAYQISTFPYENLSLHYSQKHEVTLDPQTLYQKIVADKRGRGGYCCELSILMYHVLCCLGFKVYMVGARVRMRENGLPVGPYIGWSHMVNIVTLEDGTKYAVDVAFGGDGATRPLLLESDHITRNIGTQDVRLIHDTIPEHTTDQKLWMYQCRNSPELAWNSFYCFTEHEFLHSDFVVMSLFASKTIFQTTNVLVIKFLRNQEQVYGKIMLVNDVVKMNTSGKTKVERVFDSEEERVDGLNKYFGITLTQEEKEGIKGMHTELGGIGAAVSS